ncbi:MAG: hypothetical protein PSX80_11485 [bacterium]|nr:hypothetical protein [bacterium]
MEETINDTVQHDLSDGALAKAAILPGVINGALNGTIRWFTFSKEAQIQITGDSISSNDLSVLGVAMQVALTISIMSTTIAYLTYKSPVPKPSYFPRVLLVTIKHAFFAFGIGTSIAILWHRTFGTIMVSPAVATAMITVIAGLASWFVSWMTLGRSRRMRTADTRMATAATTMNRKYMALTLPFLTAAAASWPVLPRNRNRRRASQI